MVVDLTARPRITAGVALASAAVLAAGPMAQRLPNFHVAWQLTQVNVSEINLTDASSALDLFSGVENELVSLASGASAAAVPASVVNPLQTWISTFQTAGANLQTLFNDWSKMPFPVLQQVAANGLQYGIDYVAPFHTAANAAVKYLTPMKGTQFFPAMQKAGSELLAGQVSTAITGFYQALWQNPLIEIGMPLENITEIPGYIATNFANTVNYFPTVVTYVGLFQLLSLPQNLATTLGTSLQSVYDAFVGGDGPGVLTNLLNTPGALTNTLLNGAGGVLYPGGGGLSYGFSIQYAQQLASKIVAPKAQNIAIGGSLATALQNFGNTLTQGWPSLSSLATIGSNLGYELTLMLQSLPSTLSNLPSTLGSLAGQVGTLLLSFLRLL
ncbi:hypothetical protein BMG05_12640 [Mycobacterium malmoense]|nr:hypothetical protein BMG05_12640 [Mycobacterium malmoense]